METKKNCIAGGETKDNIILKTQNINKIYPGTHALVDVNFNVHCGKVNVLVGENGAGKSTLMKILAGIEQPTSGDIIFRNKKVKLISPIEASEKGIGIIHQELNLFPNLNVAENVFITREIFRKGQIDHKTQEEKTRKVLLRLEHDISPKTLVMNLRIGQQQIVEIAKVLLQDMDILIMDEPTSALSNEEVAVLFRIIEELKSNNVSIIYISHRLEEVIQIGDYITVLRDGHLVDESQMDVIDIPWIINKMVGKEIQSSIEKENIISDTEVLKVESLSLPKIGGGFLLDDVSFSLKKGEILGIYGLRGAGRTELLECLFGVHRNATGTILVDGEKVVTPFIDKRIKSGIALIPEDRQREGIFQNLSILSNMSLASLNNYTNVFQLDSKKEEENVNNQVKNLSIKLADIKNLISSLSGGNQQKVIVGKSLLTSPKILLMDEPTRGIDVGAKKDIFLIMNRLAAGGMGIILVASELKEILHISDRILVFSKGKITGEFSREDATEEALVSASAV
ncbi:MAG: sugar ABC transporter ATP-binding protein, partial [Spirochaetales bacterium]|nr:sugar ABC transporter ATP-binding protein [Spirochaetales bacterium]